MRRPEIITFDCAETLVWVRWDPVRLAVDSALAVGCTHPDAADHYQRLLRSRWPHYLELNLRNDSEAARRWWRGLTNDWCAALGWTTPDRLFEEAERRLYGPDSSVFGLFEDTIPCLDALRARGVRMAVISNWDISLYRTLRSFGLDDYFEVVTASMVVGAEKPDPRIFQHTWKALGCEATSTWHVGDDPVADSQGARDLGARGILIDRAATNDGPHRLRDLRTLVEWYDGCD